jgi:calcineurin-like phosphoesterase
MDADNVIKSFLYGRRFVFKTSTSRSSLQGVIMDFDKEGKAKFIKLVNLPKVFERGVPDNEEEEEYI